MMIRARVAFRDDKPDEELVGIQKVEFMPNGESKWLALDRTRTHLYTWTFKVGEIAYIQMGVY